MSNANPLADQAPTRRGELQQMLDQLPEHELLRRDVEVALSAIDALLAGSSDHLAAVTAADLSRLLENTRHLGEQTAVPAQ